MKLIHYISLFVFASLFCLACSDDEMNDPPVDEYCGQTRYSTEVFNDVLVTTVKYGENLEVDGTTIELFMDIYEPVGDQAEQRPAMLWAYGGAFITGRRTDMGVRARELAKHGIVGVSFDYRLLKSVEDLADSVKVMDIVIKAMGDMKAAIRYLREDAATANDFRIDPDKIFVGGLSAGAITALLVAFVDENDILPPFIQPLIEANGGLEGNSGDAENLQYSSSVSGVVSLSGGIYDLDWIDTGDPPIISMHGDADQVVNYGFDFAMVSGINILRLYGSGPIHLHANQINLTNGLLTVNGGGHSDIYVNPEYQGVQDQFEELLYQFLANLICL